MKNILLILFILSSSVVFACNGNFHLSEPFATQEAPVGLHIFYWVFIGTLSFIAYKGAMLFINRPSTFKTLDEEKNR